MEKETNETKVLSEVFYLINQWMKNADSPEEKVLNFQAPKDLANRLNLNVGTPVSHAGMMDEVKAYLEYAVKTNHPAYLNQLFGGFNFPAFVGEVITALTNTSMYTYEVAPVATLMERKVIEKMLTYTGWNSGNGSMMTGGSNTNLVAMLLARNTKFPSAKLDGIAGLPKMAIYVSERSHFSMLKGANTIGIGQNGVIKVKLDENGRMRGEALRAAIEQSVADGYTPLMVCSTAGTTETGSFDALDENSEIAKSFGIWHHVDGSWGGSAIISESKRTFFKGLDQADSFSWNPHKLMSIPLVCSVLLVKDEKLMKEAIATQNADYIYHDNENACYDFGPDSLQCGRRVDVLKLWLAWKFHGDHGYAQRIDHVFSLAAYATKLVDESEELELLFPTQSLNVNFRFKVPGEIDSDGFNKSLRYRLLQSGQAMVNYCYLDEKLAIRLVLLNPDLTEEDIKRFFEKFASEGKAMLQSELETPIS